MIGTPLPKPLTILSQTDAQAAEQLMNCVSRQFVSAYNRGAGKEILDEYTAIYRWLNDVAGEDEETGAAQ